MKQTLLFTKLFVLLALCATLGCRPSLGTTVNLGNEIEQVMASQSQAWNKGDLEAFMEPYWKSDSLLFLGKSGPTYGWEKTLQNYRKNYPSPEAMGKLTFTLIKTEKLSKDAAFVVGKWHLGRSIGDLEGHFTLLFRKIDSKWKIVADHSS
ncbi:L-asparaginase [Rufibacter tibetensis]|uniref:L-asparaginase n=1 Tax=Rufibacter tibetensis TaxID=512763 RepID=A0A0P0CVE5_9BACT|nr:L-asparaginase [Rufibacter tibetensis]